MSEPSAGTVEDVRRFLSDLETELPELFAPNARPEPVEGPIGASTSSARTIVLARVAHWAVRMGASHRRVFVKDQRTLWGSCSAQGNLNFNWRLTLAPLEVLDYVVVHELAHLSELNHSKRFWAVVERWCPDWKARRRWLRKNGRELLKKPQEPTLNA